MRNWEPFSELGERMCIHKEQNWDWGFSGDTLLMLELVETESFPVCLILSVFRRTLRFITGCCSAKDLRRIINFQEFKYELLEPGLVDHIFVSINKSVAKIYVRNTPRNQTDSEVVKGTGGQYKFYFNIGSVKSFEENLKAAQEELGLEPDDYVPVTYSFEVDWWQQELMRDGLTAIALFSGSFLLFLYMIT